MKHKIVRYLDRRHFVENSFVYTLGTRVDGVWEYKTERVQSITSKYRKKLEHPVIGHSAEWKTDKIPSYLSII